MKPQRQLFLKPAYYFACATAFALLFALQEYSMARINNYKVSYSWQAAYWMVHCYLWAFLGLALWRLLPSFPLERKTLTRDAIFHALFSIILAFGELAVFVILVQELHLFLTQRSFTERLLKNFSSDVMSNIFVYLFLLGIFRAVEYARQSQERELLAIQLENRLNEARLQLLKSQLNPHFIFNALNSISSLMRKDVEAADAMLDRLGGLLRLVLACGEQQQTSLRAELQFVEEYLALQEIRFRDQMRVEFQVDPKVLDALVPSMIMQPLVENAVVHGVSQLERLSTIKITGSRNGSSLQISICNDAPGLSTKWQSASGLGLRNTRDRLRAIYGPHHEFSLMELRYGEVEAKLVLPFQPSQSLRTQIHDLESASYQSCDRR